MVLAIFIALIVKKIILKLTNKHPKNLELPFKTKFEQWKNYATNRSLDDVICFYNDQTY